MTWSHARSAAITWHPPFSETGKKSLTYVVNFEPQVMFIALRSESIAPQKKMKWSREIKDLSLKIPYAGLWVRVTRPFKNCLKFFWFADHTSRSCCLGCTGGQWAGARWTTLVVLVHSVWSLSLLVGVWPKGCLAVWACYKMRLNLSGRVVASYGWSLSLLSQGQQNGLCWWQKGREKVEWLQACQYWVHVWDCEAIFILYGSLRWSVRVALVYHSNVLTPGAWWCRGRLSEWAVALESCMSLVACWHTVAKWLVLLQ